MATFEGPSRNQHQRILETYRARVRPKVSNRMLHTFGVLSIVTYETGVAESSKAVQRKQIT
jgi:hypothetical protein